jgi:hypothetical protein
MASKRYDKIWKAIKAAKTAKVRCRELKAQTIIHEVKKVKSAENTARIGLGLPGYGRLTVRTEEEKGTDRVLIIWKLLELELAENL